MPSLYPDCGTVSVPKYWGGQVVVSPETCNPFSQPVAAAFDEALALTPRPVNDPEMDAARAVRLYRQLGEPAWLRSPDMQGTLNTAGMILQQEELLMGNVSEPDKVREANNK